MKKIIAILALSLTSLAALASGGGAHLDDANIDLSDNASLQKGAKLFVNHCLSCHSAKFQRFNRMAKDIGLTDQEVIDNLMFTTDKVGNTMTIAMPSKKAEQWFGVTPPDLSVITRARGVDWIYTYLRSFYVDDSKGTGYNNIVFPDVGMPHVLWKLQGTQVAEFEGEGEAKQFKGFKITKAGDLNPEEFDLAMRDLTNFLSYVGEPIQLERRRIGTWVLIFLGLFFVLAYLLKKEYWKDVH